VQTLPSHACVGSPDGAEPLSVERAFRAIRRSDVVALVIDAVDGITQQDFRCGLGSDPDRVAVGVLPSGRSAQLYDVSEHASGLAATAASACAASCSHDGLLSVRTFLSS